MNKVILIGRLTRDPELRYVGSSQSALSEFTLAVDRKYKSSDGSRKTDFIKIEAWDKKAEFCSQYLKKGNLISIEASILVDKYKTENGEQKSITKIRLSEVNFVKTSNNSSKNDNRYSGKDLFEENEICVDIAEEDIPF